MTKLIHAQINSFLFLLPNYSVELPVNSHWYSAVLCAGSVTKSCPALLPPRGLYVTRQALLSMGFPRREYWRRLPFPFLFFPAILFSRGFSWPWDRTCVSYNGRWVLYTEPPGKPCSWGIMFYKYQFRLTWLVLLISVSTDFCLVVLIFWERG